MVHYVDTVIFDLDGTLLNTLDDLANSANFALSEMSFPKRTVDEVRNFVGNGVEMLIRRAVPENTSEDKINECLALFKIHYLHHSADRTQPYEGIETLLKNLKRKGIKTAVLSNKFDKAVKTLCEDYFPGLIIAARGECGEIPKKPSPEGIHRIIEQLGSKHERTVIVGDSETDILSAKNAGIYSIGVLWGFRDEETLIKAGADELVDSPQNLEYVLT